MVSEKILIATAAALLVLTFITVAVAKVSFEEVEMHELTIIVALGIAVIKAALVCLFFMHLRWDKVFCTILFFIGLTMGGGTLIALVLLFSDDRTEFTVDAPPQAAMQAPATPAAN